jgi:hypothetical protein
MKEGKRECQAVEQLFSALYRVIGLLNASRDEPTSIEIHLPISTLILKIDKQCLINGHMTTKARCYTQLVRDRADN